MNIAICLCHESVELNAEIREAVLAFQLILMGHRVEMFRLWNGNHLIERRYFENLLPAYFFPTDNPDADIHAHVSGSMASRVAAESPDMVVFKGVDYALVDSVLDRLDLGRTKIGVVIGGTCEWPTLHKATFVLAESRVQIEKINSYTGRLLPSIVVGKWLDWEKIEALNCETALVKHYDVVNVGTFEWRKNQIALRSLFGHFSVAFVGDGPLRHFVENSAATHKDVRFFGSLSNEMVLQTIAQSRIMVHSSLFEGVPRVFAEALAIGVPVVALESSLTGDLGVCSAVRLVADEAELRTAATSLLKGGELEHLGMVARAFARASFGPSSVFQAATFIHGLF